MALRRILKFPAPDLTKTAVTLNDIDGTVDEVLRDMTETMYAAPGVGLAAPQVGVGQRLVTLDVDHEDRGKQLLQLINPVIVEREGMVLSEEGCLSVVDFSAEVRRSAKIVVKAWTLDQREVAIEAEGLLAVALQHEIDHLDGKLFIDRLTPLKRDSYKRRVKKMLRDGVDLDTFRPSDSGI